MWPHYDIYCSVENRRSICWLLEADKGFFLHQENLGYLHILVSAVCVVFPHTIGFWPKDYL